MHIRVRIDGTEHFNQRVCCIRVSPAAHGRNNDNGRIASIDGFLYFLDNELTGLGCSHTRSAEFLYDDFHLRRASS